MLITIAGNKIKATAMLKDTLLVPVTNVASDGDDRFIPTLAAETIDGGLGIDTLDFQATDGVHVSLDNTIPNTGTAAGDIYLNIENVEGSLTGADFLDGNVVANILSGFGGNDTLDGGDGSDTLFGGSDVDSLFGDAGNDVLFGGTGNDGLNGDNGNDTLNGDDGDDTLFGDIGNDVLSGGAGKDRLLGFDGDDVLRGGEGEDLLFGGAGSDAFILGKLGVGEADGIADFEHGVDRIVFTSQSRFGPTLPEDRFHSGLSNEAQDADDRVIFRTTDATLWFDKDGSGDAFAAVMVADFLNGTVVTASDIFFEFV